MLLMISLVWLISGGVFIIFGSKKLKKIYKVCKYVFVVETFVLIIEENVFGISYSERFVALVLRDKIPVYVVFK